MRIQRVATKQGHAVPPAAVAPRGPFPPELFATPKIVTDYEPQPDGGGDPVPEEGTAQNLFQPIKWYRCRLCMEAVREQDLDSHFCEEIEDDGPDAA